MTNLFSTRQLIRFHEPIQLDRILYARFNIVLTGIFTFISAGTLATLLLMSSDAGLIFYLMFVGLLGIREYIKRKYTKYIFTTSDDSPMIDILSLLKLRDRFGVSILEQALLWGLTAATQNYLAIIAMILVTALRLATQYLRLVKAEGPK
jgi:hypothetical protein